MIKVQLFFVGKGCSVAGPRDIMFGQSDFIRRRQMIEVIESLSFGDFQSADNVFVEVKVETGRRPRKGTVTDLINDPFRRKMSFDF